MERKKTGLIIVIVILSLVIVGLGGFIVYDKALNKDSKVETKVEDNNDDNINTSTEENLELNDEDTTKKETKSNIIVDDYTYDVVTKKIHKFLVGKYVSTETPDTFLEIKENGDMILSISYCDTVATYTQDDIEINLIYTDVSDVNYYKDNDITTTVGMSVTSKEGSNVLISPIYLSGDIKKDGSHHEYAGGYYFSSYQYIGCAHKQTTFKKQ